MSVTEIAASLPVTTVVAAFEDQVRRRAESPAVGCGSQTVTYGALDAWSEGVFRALVEAGVGPETSVGPRFPQAGL